MWVFIYCCNFLSYCIFLLDFLWMISCHFTTFMPPEICLYDLVKSYMIHELNYISFPVLIIIFWRWLSQMFQYYQILHTLSKNGNRRKNEKLVECMYFTVTDAKRCLHVPINHNFKINENLAIVINSYP